MNETLEDILAELDPKHQTSIFILSDKYINDWDYVISLDIMHINFPFLN